MAGPLILRPCEAAFLWFGWLVKHRTTPPPSLQAWLDAARAALFSILAASGAVAAV